MNRPASLFLVIGSICAALFFGDLAREGLWYGWVGGGVSLIAGTGLLYYLMAGFAVLSVMGRTLLALLPIALLAGTIIATILSLTDLSASVQRALIAATVVAAGWVVTFVTREWRAVSAERERRRDIIQATIVEVELISDHGQLADWEASIQAIKDAFYANRGYRVFIYYGHQFGTLRRLVSQIEILQKHQIRPVMDLFQILDRLERMEARISEPAYAELPWDRREAGVVRFLRLQSQVPELAQEAVKSLKDGPFFGWLPRAI